MATADGSAMGKSQTSLTEAKTKFEGRSTAESRSKIFRGNPLDSLDWRALERTSALLRKLQYGVAALETMVGGWNAADFVASVFGRT